MHDVIGKRKVSLDQIRQGLEILGVGEHVKKYPTMFENFFVSKKLYLPNDVITVLRYDESEPCETIQYLLEFLRCADHTDLQNFVIYCTGSKLLPILSGISIKVESTNAIFGHTCMSRLVLPSTFNNYNTFKECMKATICGKVFTSV